MLAARKATLSRISATIKLSSASETVDARFVASDLTDSGLECFVNRYVARGETVSLILEQPRQLLLKGQVTAWYPFSRSTRVLGQDSFQYRMKIQFALATQAEKDALAAFRSAL